ncbi:MAG TPA: hypothetical protein DIW30_06680 [Bacteroidales bacterium]|nr:hypothetical protein [Bacteroidales bacterium]
MPYQSIDELQKLLGSEVFSHTKDAKKAAGRALGTLVEIITYYLLNEWNFTHNVAIERGLAEYGNAEITHNVEFTMHPVLWRKTIDIPYTGSLSVGKILAAAGEIEGNLSPKSINLIDSRNIVKNACIIAENDAELLLAYLNSLQNNSANVTLIKQSKKPYAMFECKRVGVEEGARKGPQTIEKAKQGAYVAKTTSALQKIRNENGDIQGIIYENGVPVIKPYFALLDEIINQRPQIPDNFILSVGIVSNHGNWFTQENQNKELKVLAQSYDWLLFLTDQGLAQFITELLRTPQAPYAAVKTAFVNSYKENKKENIFTKVKIDLEAHEALKNYFHANINQIIGWFNVISPADQTVCNLQNTLQTLIQKTDRL